MKRDKKRMADGTIVIYEYDVSLKIKIHKRYVAAIRANTFCAKCGRQPIDFHNPEHITKPHNRVCLMAQQQRSLARILQEIRACTPLCRRCHMAEDGRGAALAAAGTAAGIARRLDPRPCTVCGELSKRLNHKMCRKCSWKYLYAEKWSERRRK